jgi:hypothetical protein
MPELPKEDNTTRMEITRGVDIFKSTPKESALWEDEGMRSFYEDLQDLSLIVHPALLGNLIGQDNKVSIFFQVRFLS